MSFTVPVEFQHRTQKFQHPDGREIDSAVQAEKILHLLCVASDMLLDLQVSSKGYDKFLDNQSDEYLKTYRLINEAYSAIYKLDTEFGFNGNTLGKVWKYPKYNIVFESTAA